MKSKADSVFAQRRMRILLEMLCGQQGKEINALLAAEPREGALRRAYQKIDDAIAEAIVEESKIIASALQEKRQALWRSWEKLAGGDEYDYGWLQTRGRR